MIRCLFRLAPGALLLAAPLAGAAPDAMPPLQDAVAEFARRAAAAPGGDCAGGEFVSVPVSAAGGELLDGEFEPGAGTLRLRYRMAFNDITEGWNWHPEEPARGGDYYRLKFLPLASVLDEATTYRGEDKVGAPQEFRVQTRYDYFFGFDNPYDFLRRDDGDDIGFAADVPVAPEEAARLAGGDLRMALRGQLADDCLSSSTTFWKATAAAPVDFTLKKRYLIGRLVDVWFYDGASGRVVARLTAGAPALSRAGARPSRAGAD